ncbi:MAG: tRNA 2-thiouridine(34) synthase MnmA [Bacillota bacterium]|nr:tRNA 2-thiouridine(34) synthase MnmA [Bacillota bacterium]
MTTSDEATLKYDHLKQSSVIIGMSGGVDSSVASLLLKQQGFTVVGLSLVTHDRGMEAAADARAVCRRLGQELIVVDMRDSFQESIVHDFVDAWLAGLTPNPCVLCNPTVKFKTLIDTADRFGFRHIATGHYASVRRHPDSSRLALAKTDSGQKDQTYFLYRLQQEQLARIIFPLDGMSKPEVRRLAAEYGLEGEQGTALAEKPDSQDICFIPDQDYLGLLREEIVRRGLDDARKHLEPGPIVDVHGQIIGTHKGLLAYTIGQRKGFDVKTTERLFVIARHFSTNTLVVGPFEHVLKQTIQVKSVVYSGIGNFDEAQPVTARVRSSAQPAACRVFNNRDKSLTVRFDQPVASPAPGQSCVFYDRGLILAGGIITESAD